MTRNLSALAFIVFLLITPPAATKAASPAVLRKVDSAAIDQVVAAQMARHGLPGVALAVVQGNEVAYKKGYGTSGGRLMTPQTQMFIGSQSKSFTALVIAQLAEQGRLDLNAPVQTYLPWFRVADELASSKISLNHLLHHTSGLSESGFGVVLPQNTPLEEAVRSLAQAHLTAPVGTKFQYFNLGYDVLAYIIETVTGEPYAEVVKMQVLEPLGMTHSTANPSQAANLAQGYSRLFGFAIPMRQPVRAYEIGAGYIISTAEDLALYAKAMMNQGAGLVSPESARLMFTPGLSDYGMGWFITRDREKIFHGGANETFATEVNIYPRSGLAFVLLVNEGYLVDHYVSIEQLNQSIEAVLLGRTVPPVSQGWSARWYGWVLGILVLALTILHIRNFYHLRDWIERARRMSPARRAWDIALNFILPTVILIVVFSQVKAFFDYRFNLLTTLVQFRYSLPDVFILMLVVSLTDYVQGAIKLIWVLRGKTRPDDQENPHVLISPSHDSSA